MRATTVRCAHPHRIPRRSPSATESRRLGLSTRIVTRRAGGPSEPLTMANDPRTPVCGQASAHGGPPPHDRSGRGPGRRCGKASASASPRASGRVPILSRRARQSSRPGTRRTGTRALASGRKQSLRPLRRRAVVIRASGSSPTRSRGCPAGRGRKRSSAEARFPLVAGRLRWATSCLSCRRCGLR
jgi:hypothetical protein